MAKKIFDYLTPALCSALALYLKATLSANDKSITAYVLPTLGAIALYALLTVVISLPKRLRWIRTWLEIADEAVLEGYWIENNIQKDGVSYHSIFDIQYDSRTDSYRVSGTAHHVDGKIYADWDSEMVKFDRSSTQLTYTYVGHIHVEGHPPVQGYAWLKFISTKPVERGQGFIVDCSNPPLRMNIELERIPVRMIKELIHRKKLAVADRGEFIRRYHQNAIALGQAGGTEKAKEDKH